MSEHADSQQPGPSNETLLKTNWNIMCLLCLKVTSEILRCPAESKRLDIGAGKGYSTLSLNITRFRELNELPMPIDLICLDEGNGVEATLRKNKAKWHKSCHSKFNITKLKRAEKRKHSREESDFDTTPRKYTRKSSFLMADKTDICFFVRLRYHQNCSMKCQHFHLDSHVRECALVLQDERLLIKLSAGDMIAQEAKYHLKLYTTKLSAGDMIAQEAK